MWFVFCDLIFSFCHVCVSWLGFIFETLPLFLECLLLLFLHFFIFYESFLFLNLLCCYIAFFPFIFYERFLFFLFLFCFLKFFDLIDVFHQPTQLTFFLFFWMILSLMGGSSQRKSAYVVNPGSSFNVPIGVYINLNSINCSIELIHIIPSLQTHHTLNPQSPLVLFLSCINYSIICEFIFTCIRQ